MRKNIITLSLIGLFLMPGLIACGNPVTTTYSNKSDGSIFGEVTNFSLEPDQVKPNDILTFKVKPVNDNFTIGVVSNNGAPCEFVSEDDGYQIFKTTIKEGKNNILATFDVKTDVDIVDQFKMTLTDDVFKEVMHPTTLFNKSGLDFRRCGIEQVCAPLKFDEFGNKVKNTYLEKSTSTKPKDVFINYVDGDTTHMITNSLHYTVKMRYVGINTPESTSELEEWGLTASYFNKLIYSGDEKIYNDHLKISTPEMPENIGVTSCILMSPAFAYSSSYIPKESLFINIVDEDGNPIPTPYEAEVDGYGRNLVFIWYSTVENPTINDFRCLNLEMAAQGLSIGGDTSDMNADYELAFSTANLLAEANRLHRFSGEDDVNYDYYKRHDVPRLELSDLYNRGTNNDPNIKYDPVGNPLCDKRTLYKIHGYVSRTTKTSFYIQDKPYYSEEYLEDHDPYGLYMFTLRDNALVVGNEVDVVVALSSYGGCYQGQGLSYHDLHVDPNRDVTVYPDVHEIVPIEVTGQELIENRYPSVLVKLTDPCYGCNWDAVNYSVNYGGAHAPDSNETYPMYNSDNEMNVYFGYGKTDNTATLNKSSLSLGNTSLMRIKFDAKALLSYQSETALTTKFFGGGTNLYNERGCEYATLENPDTIVETYTRKKLTNVVGISCPYVSSSNNTRRMEIVVLSSDDVTIEAIQ